LSGAGNDSGAGRGFICIPLWQALFCAAANMENPMPAATKNVTVYLARRDARQAKDKRSILFPCDEHS
jgi:hypothetical protein